MKKLLNYLLEKWDWFVYHRSYKSINRILQRNPGMGYLLELHIRAWREKQNLSPELMKSTETFFESLIQKEESYGN